MISVVLLTYNSALVLPDCIQSLKQCSSASELEIIIADNGSIDGTVDWLHKIEQNDEFPFRRIKILELKCNKGFAYGNNIALHYAKGDFILLLNPDTIVGENTIGLCVSRLKERVNIGAIGCRLLLKNGSLDLACRRSFPTLWNSFARFSHLSFLFPRMRSLASYNLTYLDEQCSYPVDCICGAFMMVPRHVYESVGGLDDDFFMYGEDIEWCYRIKRLGYEIWYEGAVITIHLKGGNGGKSSAESLQHFYEAMYLYYSKTRHLNESSIRMKILKFLLRALWHIEVAIKY